MEKLSLHDAERVSFSIPHRQGEPCKIKINAAALHNLLKVTPRSGFSEPEFISFNLLADTELTFSTEIIKPFLGTGLIWEGSVPGQPELRAHLSVTGLDDGQGLFIAGAFRLKGQRFVITPAGADYVCVHLPEPRNGPLSLPPVKPQSTAPESGVLSVSADESVAVIHALALYPKKMLTLLGEKELKAIIGHMQQTAAQVFKNSGINATVSFIASESLATLEHSQVEDMLNDVGDVDTGGTGNVTRGKCWDAVTARRNAHKADIVVLLGEGQRVVGGSIVGKAISIPEPVRFDQSDLSVATLAVCVFQQNDAAFIFCHELGHLLGGKHSRHVQPTREGLSPMYDYAHAYISPDKSYVTMMGYDVDAKEILPAFSAADLAYNGKPLGVAIDKPGAADVASLFRLTTRVMATYGGGASDRTQTLNVEVDPLVGGTVLPAELGPYTKGTNVNVKAVPRAGHAFKHWLLDGVVAGTKNIMSVLMDKPHTLRAVFENGQNHWITALPDPTVAQSGGTLRIKPEGFRFPYGTEVTLSYQPDKYKRSHATFWVVDGNATGVPVTEPLTLLPEQDVQVGVQLDNIAHYQPTYLSIYSSHPGGKQVITPVFYDMWGPLSNRKYTVSILSSYGGIPGYEQLTLGENTVVTDSKGVAVLHYEADIASLTYHELGIAYLAFRHENEAPLVLRLMLAADKPKTDVHHFTISDRNQYILAGSRPSDVRFTASDIMDRPDPRGRNEEFIFTADKYPGDKTGIKLPRILVKTDASAKGSLSFSASGKQGAGTNVIRCQYSYYHSYPFSLIHVLPEKIGDFLAGPESVAVKVGDDVEYQIISVKGTYSLFHLSDLSETFSDLSLKIEMADGGTGLRCLHESVSLSSLPFVSAKTQGFPLFMGRATSRGTATMRLYLENQGHRFYSTPLEIIFRVS